MSVYFYLFVSAGSGEGEGVGVAPREEGAPLHLFPLIGG
jgi:hypothetical protein